MDKNEVGYSHDIALQQLLELYASDRQFVRDCYTFNTQPELAEVWQKWLNLGRKEGLIPSLMKYRDNYTRITREWRHNWQTIAATIPNNSKLEAEKLAEKWGLRCDWGCGFLLDSNAIVPFMFMLSPGPPNSYRRLTMEISVYDTADSIKQKLVGLKHRAKEFQQVVTQDLTDSDYRGFEKQPKKDISTQIKWLFWHITPPYLNAEEIVGRLENDVDQFYVQRCYQNMAKLLGIKLVKGWQKGRKRASQQPRAKLRRAEIEAKTW